MYFFFNLEHLPGIFHHQKIVFHAFISIMVIMPYLHFHFFWRARQWTSHIPSSSALSEQGLNKKQHTTLVVTAACVSNSFFLFASESSSMLSWFDSLCKNPYLMFHSSQIPACEHRETEKNMLFLLFLFLQKRDLILSVSPSVWSPVTDQPF